MLKVALVSPGYLPVPAVKGGAIETWMTTLIDMNEKDHRFDFDLFTCREGGRDFKYNNTKIFRIRRKGFAPFIFRCQSFFIRRILKKDTKKLSYYEYMIANKGSLDKYDCILVENSMGICVTLSKTNPEIKNKIIYHMRNSLDAERTPERARYVGENCAGVLGISKYICENFKSAYPSDRVKLFYNRYDTSLFSPENTYKEAAKIRKKLGIQSDELVFGCAGRCDPTKGMREAVMAFKMLLNKHQNVKLMIIGGENYSQTKDEYTKEVQKMISDIRDHVVYTDFVSHRDMPCYYSATDVMLMLTQDEEAFGMVAVESMAMGRPVIATVSGGIPEILDESCAFFVEKNNDQINHVFENMEKLLLDKKLYARMCDNAIKRAEQHIEFHNNNLLSDLETAIEEIISTSKDSFSNKRNGA